MHRILSQELEALEEIYLSELTIIKGSSLDNWELKFNLSPATGEKINDKWVSMTLCIFPPQDYPSSIPCFKILNPRGLEEEHTNQIVKDMTKLALDRIGQQMIFELVELAKETLNTLNVPHVQCMICLDDLSESGEGSCVKTSCLHYFHLDCLKRYFDFLLIDLDKEETEGAASAANKNSMICPICREDISELFNGSSLDKLADDLPSTVFNGDFKYVPSAEMLVLQNKMKEMIEAQRAKGGIIDEEAEKKKYFLPKDFVYQGLKEKEELERKKAEDEKLKSKDTRDSKAKKYDNARRQFQSRKNNPPYRARQDEYDGRANYSSNRNNERHRNYNSNQNGRYSNNRKESNNEGDKIDGSSNKKTNSIDERKQTDSYRNNKKEKSTDCDSALIPLLCVHG